MKWRPHLALRNKAFHSGPLGVSQFSQALCWIPQTSRTGGYTQLWLFSGFLAPGSLLLHRLPQGPDVALAKACGPLPLNQL